MKSFILALLVVFVIQTIHAEKESRELSMNKILEGCIGKYPGYEGDLTVKGKVRIYFEAASMKKVRFRLAGLEANCENCGIHVHSGTSCDTDEEVGGHYWNDKKVDPDPWTTTGGAVYTSEGDGKVAGSFPLVTGYPKRANKGHAVVVHSKDGTRIGCGTINNQKVQGCFAA